MKALLLSMILLLSVNEGCEDKAKKQTEQQTDSKTELVQSADLHPSVADLAGTYIVTHVNDTDFTAMETTLILSEGKAGMRVSGKAPCNQYGCDVNMGKKGDAMKFGMMMMTKMYCADKSKQENAFVKAMGAVTAYKKQADGGLHLLAGNTVIIKAKTN